VDTIRVDIAYRPLRIGWAIEAGDIEAFRSAVRLSYALWGGRFNPVLIANNESETKRLVDLFRVDVIWPIGDGAGVKALPEKFPYLINPFFHKELFVGGANERKYAQVLDIQNAVSYLVDSPGWLRVKDRAVRLYSWRPDDPLADLFLIQYGAYPSVEETWVDYREIVKRAADATELWLEPGAIISARLSDHPSIPFLSRLGLERHHSMPMKRDSPGFFVGDAANLEDLVSYWNLRAADIPLWFVDPNRLAQYVEVIPDWEKRMRESVAHRPEWDRDIAVWSRREDIDEVRKPFGGMKLMFSHVSEDLWNGLNLLAPMMSLGSASVLGVVGPEREKIKISFTLSEKPFSADPWFFSQHLAASISFTGGLYDEQHTLSPPYLPELNEFYARTMHFEYDKLRIEPGRVGLFIDAADHDSFLYALPVADLIERLFGIVGYESKLSSGGLIARQLIARVGGLQGARVFKIPGVRRLLRTHGPTASFTKKGALQLIGGKDPQNPGVKFSDHESLYIEQRPREVTKLTPDAVFAYLVEKGLFRIGAELTCPSCRMSSWTALDALKQRVVCELCGREHDATRQLVNGEWHYRRSGVMGAERNAQGAVPVTLTLQQLATTLHGFARDIYSPSLEIKPRAGVDLPTCEVDFVWVAPELRGWRPPKTGILLGECKDQGPIELAEFEQDVENLRRVADAFPRHRFETFIVLSKLAPFTPEEIQRARTLNGEYQQRVILLTARELEPYMIYERTKREFPNIRGYGGTLDDLAHTTSQIYFPAADPGAASN
jgi:hypothetical protein